MNDKLYEITFSGITRVFGDSPEGAIRNFKTQTGAATSEDITIDQIKEVEKNETKRKHGQ